MKTLLHSLEMGLTCPVYLFYGEERLLLDQALEQLIALVAPGEDNWNREIFRGDEVTVGQVLDSAQDSSFFGGKRLIIVKDIPWMSKKNGAGDSKELEQLAAYAAAPNEGTVLVLTMSSAPDKRRKLLQSIAKTGRVVEFALLKAGEREHWLSAYLKKQGKAADRAALEYVCVNCSGGLYPLKQEADKLLLYAAGEPRITLAMVRETVSRTALAGVFELTDAAASRQAAQACRIYRELLAAGEAEQMLLAMLGNQYRNILAMQDLLERRETVKSAAKTLGIHPFVAEKCAAAARRYSRRQLFRALELLLAADIAQKTGQGNLKDSLETAILRICLA